MIYINKHQREEVFDSNSRKKISLSIRWFYSRIESIFRFRRVWLNAKSVFNLSIRGEISFFRKSARATSFIEWISHQVFIGRENRGGNCGESNHSWSQRFSPQSLFDWIQNSISFAALARGSCSFAGFSESAPRNHCSQGISEAKFVPESYPASRMLADGRKCQDWPVSRPRFSSLDRVHKYFPSLLRWIGRGKKERRSSRRKNMLSYIRVHGICYEYKWNFHYRRIWGKEFRISNVLLQIRSLIKR